MPRAIVCLAAWAYSIASCRALEGERSANIEAEKNGVAAIKPRLLRGQGVQKTQARLIKLRANDVKSIRRQVGFEIRKQV